MKAQLVVATSASLATRETVQPSRPINGTVRMRKLIVSEFVTLDGVMQAPGGKDEDRDGGFEHGGWTWPCWHDDIGRSFFALMQECDTLLLGRRTYVTHAETFEPMPAG